jgi:hypothetical protein
MQVKTRAFASWLCRLHLHVCEQSTDRARDRQQQMARETVAERVRRDALWDTGLSCSLPDGADCIAQAPFAWVPIREDSLISRLTLESASKQRLPSE